MRSYTYWIGTQTPLSPLRVYYRWSLHNWRVDLESLFLVTSQSCWTAEGPASRSSQVPGISNLPCWEDSAAIIDVQAYPCLSMKLAATHQNNCVTSRHTTQMLTIPMNIRKAPAEHINLHQVSPRAPLEVAPWLLMKPRMMIPMVTWINPRALRPAEYESSGQCVTR